MSDPFRTIIISPHSDDVAFSVGGSLLAEFFPRPILIATVFTRSISADYFDGPRDVQTITKLRGDEDRAYAKSVGADMVRFGFPEATYSRKSGVDLFPLNFATYLLWGWGAIPPHPAPPGAARRLVRRLAAPVPVVERSAFLHWLARRDSHRRILRPRVAELLDQNPGATLVSPLGIGTHANHVAVAEVCKSLKSKASKLYFFEDLSYALPYKPNGVRRFVRIFDKQLRPVHVDITKVMETKVDKTLIYTSQIKRHETVKFGEYASRVALGQGKAERLWTYPSA